MPGRADQTETKLRE